MKIHPMSLTRTMSAFAFLCLMLFPTLTQANLVRVEGEKTGSGMTRRKGFACFLVTPAHVVGELGEVKIVGRGDVSATASFPDTVKSLKGQDLAILRINGDKALDFCSEPWPDAGDSSTDDSLPWQARYVTPKGDEVRVDVLFESADQVGNVRLKAKNQRDPFFEGLSGSIVFSGGRAAALVLRIPNVDKKEALAEAYRWGYVDSLIKGFFETGTEWHALAVLGKSVVGLAIFNGRLFAATDRGGVFRYDDSQNRWEDVSGPLAGRAMLSLESFGVYLMASSNDYATKKAGWSLMGDDYKWLDMGLSGSIVQSIRVDHIYLHYGTYGAYLRGRGSDQPVVNNKGFSGLPHINAVEPTDQGVFAGLGPSNDPKDSVGLWFLPKDGDRWLAVKGADEEDVHSLAANSRYVFAGTTTDGVIRVDSNGSNSKNLSIGLPKGQVVHKLAAQDNRILAGTLGAGVYGSSDNGEHWVDFNDDQTHSERITSLLIANENRAYAGTSSGKLFVTTLPIIAARAPKQGFSETAGQKFIKLSAFNNTCSFRDGVDFVSKKTEYQVPATCTGLHPKYQFTAKFSGVVRPDNPHQVPGLPLSTWVDMWLTDSLKGSKAVGQPNFTHRINDDYIRPHDATLTGEVPASGRVTVYLVLDHCQTWTYETTCSTIGNSHLLITASPKN